MVTTEQALKALKLRSTGISTMAFCRATGINHEDLKQKIREIKIKSKPAK